MTPRRDGWSQEIAFPKGRVRLQLLNPDRSGRERPYSRVVALSHLRGRLGRDGEGPVCCMKPVRAAAISNSIYAVKKCAVSSHPFTSEFGLAIITLARMLRRVAKKSASSGMQRAMGSSDSGPESCNTMAAARPRFFCDPKRL